MKKKYKIIGLDCANCAAKLEKALSKIEGVSSARVNFMTQKVTLDIDEENEDKICQEILKVTKKTLPDVELI